VSDCHPLAVGEAVEIPVRADDGAFVEIYGRRIGDPASPQKRLLLHGVGLTWATWRQILPGLGQDADCLAIDLAGFGRSRAPHRRAVTMAAQGRLMPRLLDALRWPAATIIGHSMGGGVALGLAMLQPRRVRSLVLVGSVAYPQKQPIGFYPLHLPGSQALLAALSNCGHRLGFARVLSRGYGYDLPAVTDMLERMGQFTVATAFADAVRDLTPHEYHRFGNLLRTIQIPTLIVHGRRDPIVPPAIAARLHDELPDSELVWLPCGHLPQESRPSELVAAVRAFTRRLD
jgi:pimeloyl-ACP methyl ester carboxylesterase